MDCQASNALFDDDHNLIDESNEGSFEVQELDDAYAFKYFRKFEPDPNYDRNAPMPFDDGSVKAYYAIRHHCKERGISHIRQDGTIQPPRQIREACMCRRLCYMKFLDDVRSKLLNNLLGLSAAGQILFLSNHIKCIAVRRPSARKNTGKKTRLYYFPSNSRRIRVCVKMFINTYDISEKKLRLLNQKIRAGAYDYLAKKATIQKSKKALQSIPYSIKQERSIAIKSKDIHKSMNSMKIPHRDLGEMEAYFLRYDISAHKAHKQRLKLRTRSGRLSANKEIAERQILKVKGYAYIRHDGSMAPARSLKPVCSCRLMCSQRISNDARQILLNNLLNLSAQGQENFLYKHAHVKNVTKQRNILHHILPTSTEPIRVCREMFLNTFDIHEKRMRYILDKKRREEKLLSNIENDDELSCKEDDGDSELEEAASCSIPKTEIYDDNHVGYSSELLQTKTEDGMDRDMDNNEQCISNLELLKTSKENSTIVSNLNSNVMFDDVFLDQYFHRYSKNVDAEGQSYKNTGRNTMCEYTDYGDSFESCSCITYECASWLSKDLQQKIFTRYSKLSDLNQNRFLYRHIRKKGKRRGKKSKSGRNFSLFYYIPTIKGDVKVCKVMFMSTFKITDKKIRTIIGCEELAEPLEKETVLGSRMETNEVELNEFDLPNVTCESDTADCYIDTVSLKSSICDFADRGNEKSIKIETEDKCLSNVVGSEPEVVTNKIIKMAADEEMTNIAFDARNEYTENNLCSLELLSQIEYETDDVFLDQYFYRYETNFGYEIITKNKDKYMRKCWSFNDVDEKPLEPCNCVTYNCSSLINENLRHKIYSRYVGLSALNKKRFLYRHIRKEMKRRKHLYPSRRNFSMFYFLPTKKGYMKVCKVMFMNTFKVTDKKLRTIISSEQFSEPAEDYITLDHTNIKQDPDDIMIDFDANFVRENATESSSAQIDVDQESCSTTEYSKDYAKDSSIEHDDRLDIYNLPANTTTIQPIVELEDDFLAKYFARYETYNKRSKQETGKPRKIWIKHDESSTVLQSCLCHKKCYDVYPETDRQILFRRFINLSTVNQKRFLFRHIKLDLTNRRNKLKSSRRKQLWLYYLPAKSGQVKICKKMFMHTFNVTEKKIRHLMKQKEFANESSDEDGQQIQNMTANDSDDYSHNPTDTFIEWENNSEPEQRVAEPLFPVRGCNYVTSSHDESDEKFIDKYFHQFNSKPGENLMSMVTLHENFSFSACACFRNCNIRFPIEIRAMLFSRYTQLTVENKHNFLKMHVKKDVELCSMTEQSTKSSKYIYYLPNRSGIERVCNIMFLGTFNIRENELRIIDLVEESISPHAGKDITERNSPETMIEFSDIKIENHSDSESSVEIIVGDDEYELDDTYSVSLPEPVSINESYSEQSTSEKSNLCMSSIGNIENNSKHEKETANAEIRFAKEHVCSFPRITSHFCKIANKTIYLSCFLDVTRMYISYINECTKLSKEPIHSNIYNTILQNERIKDPHLSSVCSFCNQEENGC